MRTKKSAILEAVHESAKDLFDSGLMDKTTMREFDRLCLQPVIKLEPDEIKQIRKSSRVSQSVFAAVLNTSVYSVQKWEAGTKNPTGTALKLLNMAKDKGLEALC